MLDNRQPLWLPRGSIRAIIALIVVAPVAILALTSNITLTGDQFVGLVSLIIGAYFVQKTAAQSK